MRRALKAPAIEAVLLADYNAYCKRCSATKARKARGEFMRDFVMKSERAELFRAFTAWCVIEGYDPRLMLYACFKSRGWFWPPRLLRVELINEKAVAVYKDTKGLDGYRRYYEAQRNPGRRGYDPNVDLSPTVEARKRRLQNNPGLCLDLLVDETYGYHPKSEVCVQCVLAAECAARLENFCAPIPMVRLRAGELTVEQAKTLARSR